MRPTAPLVSSMVAALLLTSCAGSVPGGQVDDAIRTVAGAGAGPRASYDDLVMAGRRVPLASVPGRNLLSDRVLSLGRKMNNEYHQLAVDLACDAFASGARRTHVPDVNTVLRDMWAVVDENPDTAAAVEFQCLLNGMLDSVGEL